MWSHLKNVIRSLFYIPQMFGYDVAFSINPEKDSIDPWTISVYSLLVMKLNKAESQLIRICECMCFCALDHVLHVLPFEHLCYPDSTLFDRHTLTPRRGLWDIYVCLSLIACLSLSLSMNNVLTAVSWCQQQLCVCVGRRVCMSEVFYRRKWNLLLWLACVSFLAVLAPWRSFFILSFYRSCIFSAFVSILQFNCAPVLFIIVGISRRDLEGFRKMCERCIYLKPGELAFESPW